MTSDRYERQARPRGSASWDWAQWAPPWLPILPGQVFPQRLEPHTRAGTGARGARGRRSRQPGRRGTGQSMWSSPV